MSVAVVTGAARGMGRATLERLRGRTEHLLAVDLDAVDVEGTIGVACDVSDPAAVQDLVDYVRRLGSFRALAHAAGISPIMGDAARILRINLVGTALLLDAFEQLVEPGSAAVCWSSTGAYQLGALLQPGADAVLDDPLATGFVERALPFTQGQSGIAYGLAKRGVIRLVARAAVRWSARGGRVNSVAPGMTDTPMGRRELAAKPLAQQQIDAIPLGRMGRPEEVAAVAAFLLSSEASFVSGIDVLVDGGLLAGMMSTVAP
jgi:NAD(P)-dependent dehydrogenase (short-subunit alcohol dehydrogenase family)